MYDSEENEIEDIQEDTKFKGFLSKDRKYVFDKAFFMPTKSLLSISE